MNIAGHKVGLNHPPFIIAEMSGNHNQSLERAIDIVELAIKKYGEPVYVKHQIVHNPNVVQDVASGSYYS